MRDVSTPGIPKRSDTAYKSTYTNSYTGANGMPAPNGRVRTSQFYPSGRPYLDSTYQSDFLKFPANKRQIIAHGSSSGYRKNNPQPHNMQFAFKHPNKYYFVWSPYRCLPPLGNTTEGGLDSQLLLQKVCQDKTRSIYQEDFIQPPYATDIMKSRQTSRVGTTGGVPQESMLEQQSEPHGQYTQLSS